MKVTILASGSKGNCALVETAKTKLLIDAGISYRKMVMGLNECGVDGSEIDGILITHEHSDHVCGLELFTKKFRTPVYINELTRGAIKGDDLRELIPDSIDIGIERFPTSHDAADPSGFVLSHNGQSLGWVTDCGYISGLIYAHIRPVQMLFIEANYDLEMLRMSDRHATLKQRAMSLIGHLQNEDAASVIAELSDCRKVILGHLSRSHNTPQLALGAVRRLSEVDCSVASQDTICGPFGLT